METAEDKALQLAYKIVEYCERHLLRHEKENEVTEIVTEAMESFAKEMAVEFLRWYEGEDVNAEYNGELYDEFINPKSITPKDLEDADNTIIKKMKSELGISPTDNAYDLDKTGGHANDV